jgi:ubiquinone/menaquinone biosynthesis C-methylase UbiE
MARVDYDKQSANYDAGRTLPDEAIALWMVTARRHAGDAEVVLDLGAGTGRFTKALAEAFDARVIAIEPSAGMRDRAAPKDLNVIGGRAEELPLRDASIDVAWLSNVIHHLDDMPKAAAELRRVVNGSVLLRGAFGDTDVPSLFRFFPASRAVVTSFPKSHDTIEIFRDAGFSSFYKERVTEVIARNLAEMVPRIRMRADTALQLISDEDFAAGLAELEVAATKEDDPVTVPTDLLVIS